MAEGIKKINKTYSISEDIHEILRELVMLDPNKKQTLSGVIEQLIVGKAREFSNSRLHAHHRIKKRLFDFDKQMELF